jgi:hypothetical protein
VSLDREACERRAYRLATLLTGDTGRALAIMEQVLASRPDLRTLDGAHLDRLTILACREVDGEGVLAALTFQQREAWVLSQVYGTPLRETARAMDCSVTATRRHLAIAMERMAPHDGVVEGLRASSLDLDLPPLYRQMRRRHDRTRRLLLILAALTLAAGLLALIAWLARYLAAGAGAAIV